MPNTTKSETKSSQQTRTGKKSPNSGRIETSIQHSGFQLWLSQNTNLMFRLSLISFVIAFVIFGVFMWLTDNLNVENAGYAGIWVVSFIAAGTIILPLPGPAVVCIGAAPHLGLSPLLIGMVSASAETMGEMTGYMAGLSGKTLLERNKHYPRFRSLLARRGGVFLFVGAIIPNPLFDVIGIAAGSISYSIKKFLIVVFAGKAIKSTAIAYACFWGIDSVERWLG